MESYVFASVTLLWGGCAALATRGDEPSLAYAFGAAAVAYAGAAAKSLIDSRIVKARIRVELAKASAPAPGINGR